MTDTPLGIYLRPANPADFPRIAEVMSMFQPEPITAEMIAHWEQTRHSESIWQRIVALNEEGHLLGYNSAVHSPGEIPGKFWIRVAVDHALHGRGIGSLLYNNVLQFAQKHQASMLESSVRDNQPEFLRFAQKRGFTISHHHFESRLDLASFDETSFSGVIKELEASSIRFFTLADLGDTLEARRKYYNITKLYSSDVPENDYPFPSFEEFQKFPFLAGEYRADCSLVAADGENWIGMTMVSYLPMTNAMQNAMTGVDRAYRGRKIALALKLLIIHCARQYGAAYLYTNNDSENTPMLAVNRKLGYQPQPGMYALRNKL